MPNGQCRKTREGRELSGSTIAEVGLTPPFIVCLVLERVAGEPLNGCSVYFSFCYTLETARQASIVGSSAAAPRRRLSPAHCAIALWSEIFESLTRVLLPQPAHVPTARTRKGAEPAPTTLALRPLSSSLLSSRSQLVLLAMEASDSSGSTVRCCSHCALAAR